MSDQDKRKSRIRKLLALTQSPNKAEAAAALQKAAALMVDWGIEASDLEESELITGREMHNASSTPPWVRLLLAVCGDQCGVASVKHSFRGRVWWDYHGTKRCVDAAEWMFQAWKALLLKKIKSLPTDSRKVKRTYASGFVYGLGIALDEAETLRNSRALVLSPRTKAEAAREALLATGTKNARAQRMPDPTAPGFQSGVLDGVWSGRDGLHDKLTPGPGQE